MLLKHLKPWLQKLTLSYVCLRTAQLICIALLVYSFAPAGTELASYFEERGKVAIVTATSYYYPTDAIEIRLDKHEKFFANREVDLHGLDALTIETTDLYQALEKERIVAKYQSEMPPEYAANWLAGLKVRVDTVQKNYTQKLVARTSAETVNDRLLHPTSMKIASKPDFTSVGWAALYSFLGSLIPVGLFLTMRAYLNGYTGWKLVAEIVTLWRLPLATVAYPFFIWCYPIAGPVECTIRTAMWVWKSAMCVMLWCAHASSQAQTPNPGSVTRRNQVTLTRLQIMTNAGNDAKTITPEVGIAGRFGKVTASIFAFCDLRFNAPPAAQKFCHSQTTVGTTIFPALSFASEQGRSSKGNFSSVGARFNPLMVKPLQKTLGKYLTNLGVVPLFRVDGAVSSKQLLVIGKSRYLSLGSWQMYVEAAHRFRAGPTHYAWIDARAQPKKQRWWSMGIHYEPYAGIFGAGLRFGYK